MSVIAKFSRMQTMKFSFGKDTEYAKVFANQVGALSMYLPGFGLGIPDNISPENQLKGIFLRIMNNNGTFLFNISGVDLKKAKKGFKSYQDAEMNNQITEWELFTILSNKDYLKNTILHNGKVVFKKRIIWKSIV